MEALRAITPELHSLAEQLAMEPFCRKYALEKQSLAKISLFIEQRETSLERVAPEQESLKESFRHFKAAYCLFLMQLEERGPLDTARLNMDTLADYLPQEARENLGMGNTAITDEPTMVAHLSVVAKEDPDSSGPDEVTMIGEVTEIAQSPSEAPVQAAEPVGPASSVAQEYYRIALYFRANRASGRSGIAEAHLTRLEAIQICFALETEFQEKIAATVALFWAQRKEKIATLFDSKGDFHAGLVSAWAGLTQNNPAWPVTEKLPLLTFKNSLRFLTASPTTEAPRAALLEAGLWLFLFGQDYQFPDVTLTNTLALPPFLYDVICDVFVRLCRVHRLKTTLLNPSSTFSTETLAELQAHAETLFTFTQSWSAHTN